MKMHCPHCGVKGSVDESYIGRKIRCPKCKETFACQADEELIGGIRFQEPEPVAVDELPVPHAVVEAPQIEVVEDIADEPPGLFVDEEQEETPALDLEAIIAEPVEEEEPPRTVGHGEVELDGILTEDSPLPEVEKSAENEAEETEVILEESLNSQPAEETAEQPVEVPVPPEITEQEYPAEITDVPPVLPGEQQPLHLEDDLPVTTAAAALDSALLAEPADKVAESSATQAEPEPEVIPDKFAQGAKPRTDFTLSEALNEAWQYTKGAKGSIWGAVGVMYLVMLVLGLGLGFLQAAIGIDSSSAVGIWAEIGVQSLVSAISTLFTAGLMYMGVRRAVEKPISWKMVFDGFSKALKLIIASILMTLLVISGFVLLILPGIYLAIGYTMTLPLMLDRQLEPWQAMELSRKAIHKVWWKVFGIFFVMGLLYLVSTIPLGIGLVWTVPMSVILVGVVYRYLFGVQTKKN